MGSTFNGPIQDLVIKRRRHRQYFGRSIGRMHVSVGQNPFELPHQSGWHRRSSHQYSLQARKLDVIRTAIRSDLCPKSGRPKGVRDATLMNRLHDVFRIDCGGLAGIHLRHHGSHAHSRIEEREDRQHGQIDFARPDIVAVPDRFHLRFEHAMLVKHALGGSRGTRSEKHRRQIIACRPRRFFPNRLLSQLIKRSTHLHLSLKRFKGTTKKPSHP